MSSFTPAETAYLKNQRLGSLETAGADGQPHMVPVALVYKPDDAIEIGVLWVFEVAQPALCRSTAKAR